MPEPLQFTISADNVGLFAARVTALRPSAVIAYADGKVTIANEADHASAQQVFNGGFNSTTVELKALAATRRWEREVGGITVSGMPIATDRESQGMISRAYLLAIDDPDFTTKFKSADGVFVDIDAATIVLIAKAVGQHVANCFALEATTNAAIDAGTITTTAQVNEAFS